MEDETTQNSNPMLITLAHDEGETTMNTNPVLVKFVDGDEPGGGAALYDIVVPDDYPTLSEALAVASDGNSIFVKSGDYTETGGTFTLNDISITGAGTGVLNLVLSNDLVLSGNNVSLNSMTVDTNSGKKLTLSGQFAIVENCYIKGGSVGYFFTSGYNSNVSSSKFEASTNAGRIKFDQRSRIVGNHIIIPHMYQGGIDLGFYGVFTGNLVYAQEQNQGAGPLVRTTGERCTVSGNTFFCRLGQAFASDYNCAFSSNVVFQSGGNAVEVIDGGVVDGNAIMLSASGAGVYADSGTENGYSCVITGNSITTPGASPLVQAPQTSFAGVSVSPAAVKTIISSNSVAGCEIGVQVTSGAVDTIITNNTFTFFTDAVTDDGTTTLIAHNKGIDDNVGGGSVSIGDTITGAGDMGLLTTWSGDLQDLTGKLEFDPSQNILNLPTADSKIKFGSTDYGIGVSSGNIMTLTSSRTDVANTGGQIFSSFNTNGSNYIGNGSGATKRTGFGGMSSPTAKVHIAAGEASALQAPLKFTAGTLQTTPELGAVEFTDDGTDGHLYVTMNVSGVLTRVQIA